MYQNHVLACADGRNSVVQNSAIASIPLTTKATYPSKDWQIFTQAAALIADRVADPIEGQLIAQLDQSLPANPSSRLITAEINGKLAGCIYTKLDSDETRGQVGGLAVAPQYRRNGLSKNLIQAAVEDRAQIDGFDIPLSAYVRIFDGVNKPSLMAFLRCGFVASAVKRVAVRSLQTIAPHFAASAANDGTVALLLMTRAGSGIPLSKLGELKGIS